MAIKSFGDYARMTHLTQRYAKTSVNFEHFFYFISFPKRLDVPVDNNKFSIRYFVYFLCNWGELKEQSSTPLHNSRLTSR